MGENTKDCLVHYDSRHVQVRLDFLGLCAYDRALFEQKRKEEPDQECMAKVLRLFETLTCHHKSQWHIEALKARDKGLAIPPEPKEYALELSYDSIMEMTYNTFGESTLRNSIDYLIELGYIRRHQERKNSIPMYWLHLDVIQALLDTQKLAALSGCEIKPSNNKRGRGVKSKAEGLKSTGKGVKSNPEVSKKGGAGFEINTNNIYKKSNTQKDKEKDVSASAERPPASTESDLSTKSHIATTDTQTTLLQAEHERETHNGHGSIRHHGAGDTGDRSTLVPLVSADGSSSATGTQAAKQVELSPANVEKPAKPKKPVKQDENALPPDVEDVIENYKKLFNHPIPISDAIVKAAKVLAPCHPTAEKLSEARKWIRDHDEKGYYKKRGGVKLFDIVREWEAWEDAIAQQSQRTQRMNGNAENKHPQLGLMPRQNPSNEVLRKEAF